LTGINVLPILKEVAFRWKDFYIDTARQEQFECQRETMNIRLRTDGLNEPLTVDYPKCLEFLDWFENKYGGMITQVAIVHLSPNGKVYPHIDREVWLQDKDRFHLVLSGYYNTVVSDKNEMFSAGDLWWFDNKQRHYVDNASPLPRISIIFDVKDSNWREII
jgi:hypothetical protein